MFSYYLQPIYPILILFYFIKFFFLSSLEINLVSFVILLSDRKYAASHHFPSLLYPFLSFYLFPPSVLLISTPYQVLPFCSLSYSISLFSLCFPFIHSTPLHCTPHHSTATFLFLPALITSWTSET